MLARRCGWRGMFMMEQVIAHASPLTSLCLASMTSQVIERQQPYHYCARKPYQGQDYGTSPHCTGIAGALFDVYRLDDAQC
ncbi:hypothetical protein EMIT0194P_20073 [Pseudomonas serbica]